MTNDLRHHSKTRLALGALETRPQESGVKPRGLWVSVGSEWEDWCASENWGLDGTELHYQVTVADTASILTLESPQAIDDFTAAYGTADRFSNIDWAAVAGPYDGILITPYQWSKRLDHSTFWYYGWDCASGCVWNPAAIQSLTIREAVAIESEK